MSHVLSQHSRDSIVHRHTSVTVNWVWCSSPITNADFLCYAVRSTRGDRTLCPEYSLQTLSRFLTSGHLHSLLPRDAYAWTELFIICSLFLSYTFDTRMLSIVMNVLFQIIPNNATSKYKLILLCITVNALKHILSLSAADKQTLTHTILGLRLPLLPPSLQYAYTHTHTNRTDSWWQQEFLMDREFVDFNTLSHNSHLHLKVSMFGKQPEFLSHLQVWTTSF